jgi:hypothetical protein
LECTHTSKCALSSHHVDSVCWTDEFNSDGSRISRSVLSRMNRANSRKWVSEGSDKTGQCSPIEISTRSVTRLQTAWPNGRLRVNFVGTFDCRRFFVQVKRLGDHLKNRPLVISSKPATLRESDVIVLPCRSRSAQDDQSLGMLKLKTLRRGRALRSDPGPITRGWLRKNRRSRPSAVWLASRLLEGFVFLPAFLW